METLDTSPLLTAATIDMEIDSAVIFERQNSQSILNVALRALRIFPVVKRLIPVESSSKIHRIKNPSVVPEITLKEVGNHDQYNDCWIVLYDRVYDVTTFLESHPGGADVILDYGGRDATIAFHGTGHSSVALLQLKECLIGELPVKEQIFRNSTGTNVILSGIPK